MLSRVHTLTEKLTQATGPIFRDHPDYADILQASCLWFARVIQATPDRGKEFEVLDEANHYVAHALQSFLELETEAALAKAAERDRALSGVEGFADFAGPLNGHAAGESPVVDPHYRDEEGKLTPEGMAALTEAVIQLHTPDEEVVYAEMPEDEAEGEVFRESLAQVERDLEARAREAKEAEEEGGSPDGPRAYAP